MKRILSIALIAVLALSLAACGGKKEAAAPSADLPAVMESFQLGEEMMTLDMSDLNQLYFIDEKDVKQYAAAMHNSGINCDEILLFEAVDADAAGRIKAILDDRYQAKLNELRDYLPDEYAIVEKCSVTQNGNFVAMIVSPKAAEYTELYNKSIQ